MSPKDSKAIHLAACILREDADSLRGSHTVAGKWDDSEAEALREYNLLRRLAGQLERIAEK